ncbi:MAG TPA: RnfH family protein [Burkholderiales bacterium]|nr:RnfH family protein [Burkholderiales bacterium]
MKVEVVYALPEAVDAVSVSLPAGASLRDAVVASGLLERHAGIQLEKQAFGIFGRRVMLETRLTEGDRVEVYRALALDPKEARRQRAAKKR